MRKKPVFWIVVALVAVLVITVVLWGRQYYNDRYVGSDYYAMVPLDYDITPETIYSMKGADMGLGKLYELTAYNEQGENKAIWFSVMGEDMSKYPKPGTFLYVKASKQLVVGWNVIEEGKVPVKVLDLIKARN